MRRLILGTRSPDKVREIRQMLDGLDLEVEDLGIHPSAPEVDEDQPTFRGNAEKKALELAQALDAWVLADDSGLEVDALGGEPGVRSHRWAGEACDDRANNLKLAESIRAVPEAKRTARYRCVLALASPEKVETVAEGACEGTILPEPRGKGGFGYDPYFLSRDLGKTFAEADPVEKHRVSHRGRALKALRERLSRV